MFRVSGSTPSHRVIRFYVAYRCSVMNNLQKYIVTNDSCGNNQSFNIRVTRVQKMLYKTWVQKNKIMVTETFNNIFIDLVTGDKIVLSIVDNDTINQKSGIINIKIEPLLKLNVIRYVDSKTDNVKLSEIIFTLLDTLMGNKLSQCEIKKSDI